MVLGISGLINDIQTMNMYLMLEITKLKAKQSCQLSGTIQTSECYNLYITGRYIYLETEPAAVNITISDPSYFVQTHFP